MVERIRTLLETRQLTPTQFADAIGIARPIVSHILSGRNKPSLEVVQRILAAMPELSMPWLLNGTGPMLAPAIQPGLAMPAATPPQAPSPAKASSAPAAMIETGPVVKNHLSAAPVAPSATYAAAGARPAPRRFTALTGKVLNENNAVPGTPATLAEPEVPAPAQVAPAAISPEPTAVPEPALPAAAAAPAPAQEPAAIPNAQPTADATAAALFAGTEKPIRRIVIFYRDGSFADYQPE